MKRKRLISGLLLIVGLAFAFLGQFYFAYRRRFVRDGVFFWCVAIFSFGWLLWRVGRGRLKRRRTWRFDWQPLVWARRHPVRTLAALGGATLALAAGWLARQQPEMADFSAFFWTWLFGVYWFLLAFVPLSRSSSPSIGELWRRLTHLPQRVVARWRGPAALAALLLAALAVRTFDLGHIPANLGGDEGTWGMESLAMFGEQRLANPFGVGWFSFPSMSFLAWGLSMRVFGETVFGLRMLSALLGAATVWTTFLLARDLWGRRIAWLAAILLAFGHYHLHYSRLAVNNIADGLLVTLALWLLVWGLRSGKAIYFALCGAVVGLGWYGYVGARMIGILVALFLAWRVAVEQRFLARRGRLLLILPVAALVVAGPLLLYFAAHPADFGAGLHRVSILVPGWLAREQDFTGRSAAWVISRQVWKSLSGFHYTLDPTYWYRASIPLLDFVSGVFFTLGLLWATARCRRPANGLLLIWFWSSVILGWVLTENPPSSQRLVVAAPAMALLVGLGLDRTLELGQRLFGSRRRLWDGVAMALLTLIIFVNLYYYFAAYTPTRVYGNPTSEVATVLGRSLQRRDGNCTVYFHGAPVMYWEIGNLRFLARGIEGMDVPPPQPGEAPDLPPGETGCFVFLPHRRSELEAVQAAYPEGTETAVHSDVEGRLLYVLYEVER